MKSMRLVLGSGLIVACQNNTIELEGAEETAAMASSTTATGNADDLDSNSGGLGTGGAADSGGTEGSGGTDSADDLPETDGAPQVSFSTDVVPIFASKCAPQCHQVEGEWYPLDLDEAPWAALVGIPAPQLPRMAFVEPGSPQNSYLWHKVNDTHFDVGGKGLKMPKASARFEYALSPEELDTIALWILQGAPHN